ncbi:Bug family tripartite tricarboxylate transporter substrate binding protein, partial [Escherichia coli]|uniref:Bug family tripartite tricarboxylate transporter substrate binding protein n=1 Tax=Escherichia coli TaxID=562 RepID=UPI00202CB01F
MMRGLSDRRALLLWLGSIAASRVAAQPVASAWPSRALRLVAPFPEGGASDRVARLLAPELQRRLAQSVFVDNRPGAEGNIGCAEVAGSSDDHTLLV